MGIALYEGTPMLFLVQCFGVKLGLLQQSFMVIISILEEQGLLMCQGSSLPIIVLILFSTGLPGDGIAIVYGEDRFLDMFRMVLKVK